MKLTIKEIKQIIKEELSNVLETKQELPRVGYDEDPEIQEEFMKELELEGLAGMVEESIFENFLDEYKDELEGLKQLPNPKDRMEELGQKLDFDYFEDIYTFAYKAVSKSKTFSDWTTKDYENHPAGSVTKDFAHERDITKLAEKVKKMIDGDIELKEYLSLIKPFLLDLVGDKITSEGNTYSLDLVKAPVQLKQAFELWRGLMGK